MGGRMGGRMVEGEEGELTEAYGEGFMDSE